MLRAWNCWPLIRHATVRIAKRHRPHRIGRHMRRAAGVAASKPAIVGYVCVAVGGGMWGGLPRERGPLPASAPGISANKGNFLPLIGGIPGPLAYMPPEGVAELPAGFVSLPQIAFFSVPDCCVPLPQPGQETPQPQQPIPEPPSLALLLPGALVAILIGRAKI